MGHVVVIEGAVIVGSELSATLSVMPQPTVRPDWPEILDAYQHGSWQQRFYLDINSGEISCISEQTLALLEACYDDDGELDPSMLTTSALQKAFAVANDDRRFLKIPEQNSAENLHIHDSFANSCESALQRLLYSALNSNDLLRFQLILGMEPNEEARWEQFQRAAYKIILIDWLHTLGFNAAG